MRKNITGKIRFIFDKYTNRAFGIFIKSFNKKMKPKK